MKKLSCVLLITIILLSCNSKHPTSQINTSSFIEKSEKEVIIDKHAAENIKKEREHEFINVADYITLTNCTITTDYFVPNILNRTLGINDNEPPYEFIKENRLHYFWSGFQIILKNDIPLNENIIVIVKNSRHEFYKSIKLRPIQTFDSDNIFGYYENILFENKFWLCDENNWQLIVKSDDNILIDQELSQSIITAMLYEKLDETPFIVSYLKSVNIHKEYTYRCARRENEIIVIYYTNDYSIYKPILYLIPDENEGYIIDIGISWTDEKAKGIYFFKNYNVNELPSEEKMYAVMDSVSIR